jgi:hypothetical protein
MKLNLSAIPPSFFFFKGKKEKMKLNLGALSSIFFFLKRKKMDLLELLKTCVRHEHHEDIECICTDPAG